MPFLVLVSTLGNIIIYHDGLAMDIEVFCGFQQFDIPFAQNMQTMQQKISESKSAKDSP